jgi:anti-sigma B factor antagonist
MNCTAGIRRVGDVAIVDLRGRFTLSDAPGRIRDTVASALESGARNILLNLAEVTLMDSAAGIGELVISYTRALRQGGRLKLLNANKHISRVLQITRLDTIFEMYENEDAAVGSFQASSKGPVSNPPGPSIKLKSA